MYPEYRLDTPPPTSRFRRPWSPDPQDPFPSIRRREPEEFGTYFPAQHHVSLREPSDASVEALDLAEYAAILNRHNDSYRQPVFNAYDSYPPSPQSLRPFASPDSLRVPSLVSPSASSSPSDSDHSSRPPTHRPFSLPPPSLPHRSSQGNPSLSIHTHSSARDGPQVRLPGNGSEIDIARFPSFSRAWYEGDKPHKLPDPSMLPNGDGLSVSRVPDMFDPTFPAHTYYENMPYARSPPPSYPARSSRDLNIVPWNASPNKGDKLVDSDLKEERMRMLEAEFGGAQTQQDNGEKVGSVDTNGKLITAGPKKRIAMRCIEVVLAATACVSTVYTAFLIKTSSTPPPANKLPAYVLYVLSFLTIVSTTYLFLIYPCCCGGRRRTREASFPGAPGGMMVLPVQSFPSGDKKSKKDRKKKGGGGEGVQVNLIVDPTMFGGGSGERDEEWGEDGDEDGTQAGSEGQKPRRPARRRGIFAGLALEAEWRRARKQLKVRMAFDIVACILWGVTFVLILMGKRCPVGGYLGWCDGYNVGTAAAFLLSLAFGFSIFFDIKDLHASKNSPRTRPL
ncbi:hypothetical protein WOLCODRAFT_135875 [Wolfiporia cocos MD-104 SS10]|uniref:MARVEL domain-containing protein n=1 Tax=Wolfiporia cocos (strain MD-104) TaxID=742152 RepID=A0A2H3JMI1_WOLCO|nr:hypothetical protein WOLCODRAFT_135875 [Wolfiporia cocos MD-104 SS10]